MGKVENERQLVQVHDCCSETSDTMNVPYLTLTVSVISAGADDQKQFELNNLLEDYLWL